MAEDSKSALLAKLLDSLPTLLVVLGVALLLLGIVGGVTYNAWLPIPDVMGRLAAGVTGSVICGIGLYLAMRSKSAAVVQSIYGIRITYPKDGDEVEVVDIGGTIKKPLPDGYSLRILRAYPGTERVTPVGKAMVDMDKGTWLAEHCHAGGKSGERRSFVAFIVGPSGVALIDYHNEAARAHGETLDQLRNAGIEGKFLPAIGTLTADMFECHRVPIRRK